MNRNHIKLARYINDYWDELRQEKTEETKTALGLPYPFYVPSVEVVDGFSFPHMFYWDTYFTCQGFWGTDREAEILGLVENMFDLIRRFGFVPNSNSFSHLSRSQPPLLTSLIRQLAERSMSNNNHWLEHAYSRVAEEYETVWTGDEQPHIRLVHQGLSRYYDSNVVNVLAEAESGWDYTTRFNGESLCYLPIDLNSLLYKYEVDLAWLADELGHDKNYWLEKADIRKKTINDLMWDEESGMFYDYNYKDEVLGHVESLATYVPMFAGLCTDAQAERLVSNLDIFETEYGLSTTPKNDAPAAGRQWAAPNGWAPLHDLVVTGLINYGYEEHAKRIASKWVSTVELGFVETGKIYEKYNVVDPGKVASGAVYPDQQGFGWTNGVTHRFIELLK